MARGLLSFVSNVSHWKSWHHWWWPGPITDTLVTRGRSVKTLCNGGIPFPFIILAMYGFSWILVYKLRIIWLPGFRPGFIWYPNKNTPHGQNNIKVRKRKWNYNRQIGTHLNISFNFRPIFEFLIPLWEVSELRLNQLTGRYPSLRSGSGQWSLGSVTSRSPGHRAWSHHWLSRASESDDAMCFTS